MEFCPFKDLSELCKRYKRFRQYLPEPFLWDTFYHLVEAAAAMRDGPEGARWDFEIVHRDLKPGNIFLGKENAEKGFPFYPIAKTGDFGVAVMTKQGDPLNPLEYQNIGTHGYYAPEQLHDDVTPRNQKDRLSSYTNVWAIGATMLELLTLSPHVDYMNDPDYNVDGVITDIETDKKPEYSIALRDLIKSCLEPKPLERIKIGSLRACIKSNRDHLSETYEQSDNNGRARFEDDSLLYYIRNEINNMPPGRYEPIDPESPSKPEVVRFRDYDWPVVFPRFHDGPESEGQGSDDSDDSDSDDESDDGGSPERMLPKNTVHQSTGHRMSNPIDLVNDSAGKHTDTSDIWRRKDTRRKQGNARSEISDTGGAVNGSLRDGTRPSNSRLSDARAVGAVREDGGVEGLEDSLTDGLPVEAPEDGTDDESQPMESDSDDSVSMPSSSHQVPAPAPAPAAPAAQAPAHAPTPAVQAQALAPQAPAQAPAPVRPIPRKLRSGVTFGYF